MSKFNTDQEALEFLKYHGIEEYENGVFKISNEEWINLSNHTKEAIHYLINEWDFTIID